MDYTQPSEFDFDTAVGLLNSADPFPVDFDAAWQWLGYNQKSDAKSKLINNFEKGLDYSTEWRNALDSGVFIDCDENSEVRSSRSEFSGDCLKTPQGGRPSEFIKLTIDCFKSFGMMAGTEKGKEVRRYFLMCERQIKQSWAFHDVPPSMHQTSSYAIRRSSHDHIQDLATATHERFTEIEARLQQIESEIKGHKFLHTSPAATYVTKPQQVQQPIERLQRRQILKCLAKEADISAQDLAELTGIPCPSVRREVSNLLKRGLIKRRLNTNYTGRQKGTPKYFYSLANTTFNG